MHSQEIGNAQLSQIIQRLMSEGQFSEARKILIKNVAEQPDAALQLAHLEGLILIKQGKSAEAIKVFRAVLSAEPRFIPSRNILAQVLYRSGSSEAALYHARILVSSLPESDARQFYQAMIAQAGQEKPFGFSGSFAFLPSTNVNRGTDQTTIKLGDLAFDIDDASRKKSGIGLSLSGAAYRKYMLSDRLTLTTTASVAVQKYLETAQFDGAVTAVDAKLTRRYLKGFVSAKVFASYGWSGWEPNVVQWGAKINSEHDIHKTVRLGAQASIRRNDYVELDYKDGYLLNLEMSARKQFDQRLSIRLSADFSLEKTQRKHLDYIEYGAGIFATKEWKRGWITTLDLNASKRAYDGNYPGMNEARSDVTFRINPTIRNRNFSIKGITPVLSYTYTQQASNVPFFDYSSHDITLQLTKNF
ncbi:surface lipoprotein assembly modifier [Ahrensia kielensis]|uniref:Surface lipoprotein assembly modifier n=1 Tax=Ahrensia kielensis TaxID=76980 RepID=A0ABU9T3C5_9HYPH